MRWVTWGLSPWPLYLPANHEYTANLTNFSYQLKSFRVHKPESQVHFFQFLLKGMIYIQGDSHVGDFSTDWHNQRRTCTTAVGPAALLTKASFPQVAHNLLSSLSARVSVQISPIRQVNTNHLTLHAATHHTVQVYMHPYSMLPCHICTALVARTGRDFSWR